MPTVIAACHYHNINVLTQAKAHTRHTVLPYSLSLDFSPLHEACMCCLVSFSVADMNFFERRNWFLRCNWCSFRQMNTRAMIIWSKAAYRASPGRDQTAETHFLHAATITFWMGLGVCVRFWLLLVFVAMDSKGKEERQRERRRENEQTLPEVWDFCAVDWLTCSTLACRYGP